MTIQLINGSFSAREALDILTQMIHVKVKFHESKITDASTEEDIKTREKRIRDLQSDLYAIRQHLLRHEHDTISLQADIALTTQARLAV